MKGISSLGLHEGMLACSSLSASSYFGRRNEAGWHESVRHAGYNAFTKSVGLNTGSRREMAAPVRWPA